MLNLQCQSVGHIRSPKIINIDFQIAHSDQKELLKCRDDTLSDEESDAAHREIRILAGRDGLDKVMEEFNLDVIVTNSDGELAIFAAFTGETLSQAVARVFRSQLLN